MGILTSGFAIDSIGGFVSKHYSNYNHKAALADTTPSLRQDLLQASVIVSALGYFVDIYDLILFSIVRVPSLQDLGVTSDGLLTDGVWVLNMQMIGMLLGGILWGIWGDKKGRLSVLFGSILLYSIANLLNAIVTSVRLYGILRFVAGIGLAGELGAAVTLVSESVRKEHRGYATGLVAGIGVSGAVVAGLTAELLNWRWAFAIGGCLGLSLLILRIKVLESPMFATKHENSVRLGDFWMLFTTWKRFRRYLATVLIGCPIWFVIGILVTFAPEITKTLEAKGEIHASIAIMCAYSGLMIGDLASGFLSQWIGSRRRVIYGALVGITFFMLLYLFHRKGQPLDYYILAFCLGTCAGYWAVFVTVGAEQFGTNLRATVATTVPNFVRGLLVPMTLIVQALKGSFGLRDASLMVGATSILLAFLSNYALDETHSRDLDFHEV